MYNCKFWVLCICGYCCVNVHVYAYFFTSTAMSLYAVPSISFISGNVQLKFLNFFFQLKPVSTTAVVAAATGFETSVAMD